MRDILKFSNSKEETVIKSAPKLFSVSGGDSPGEVDLQWDPLPNANFYVVQLSIHSSKNLKWIQIDIITKSSCKVAGLKCGRKYCFRISAANASGCGPWSRVLKRNV